MKIFYLIVDREVSIRYMVPILKKNKKIIKCLAIVKLMIWINLRSSAVNLIKAIMDIFHCVRITLSQIIIIMFFHRTNVMSMIKYMLLICHILWMRIIIRRQRLWKNVGPFLNHFLKTSNYRVLLEKSFSKIITPIKAILFKTKTSSNIQNNKLRF